MGKIIDLTGKRFGKLIVLSRAPSRGSGNRLTTYWSCKCDCGNIKEISSKSLRNWKTESCGCKNRIKDREEAVFRYLYSNLKKRHSKFKGKLLGLEEFIEMSKKPCFYCGIEDSRLIKDRSYKTGQSKFRSDTTILINGIDRENSNIGYTTGNSRPCCVTCNIGKNTMNKIEFLEWIKRVYNFNNK